MDEAETGKPTHKVASALFIKLAATEARLDALSAWAEEVSTMLGIELNETVNEADLKRYAPPQADGKRLRATWLQPRERRTSPVNPEWTRLSFMPQNIMRIEALCILDTDATTKLQQLVGGGYDECELAQFGGLSARLFDPKALGDAPRFDRISELNASDFKTPLRTHLSVRPGWGLELDISGPFSDAAMWGVAAVW